MFGNLVSLVVLASIPLFVIGLALARWIFGGARHRGPGSACGWCGYCVDGLPSEYCSECGSDVRVAGVLKVGQRKRSHRDYLLGLLGMSGVAIVSFVFLPTLLAHVPFLCDVGFYRSGTLNIGNHPVISISLRVRGDGPNSPAEAMWLYIFVPVSGVTSLTADLTPGGKWQVDPSPTATAPSSEGTDPMKALPAFLAAAGTPVLTSEEEEVRQIAAVLYDPTNSASHRVGTSRLAVGTVTAMNDLKPFVTPLTRILVFALWLAAIVGIIAHRVVYVRRVRRTSSKGAIEELAADVS